jgi:hypothetical protein
LRSLTLQPGHSLPSFRWFRRWASELWFPAAAIQATGRLAVAPVGCLPLNTSAFSGRTLRVLPPRANSSLARQGCARRETHRAARGGPDHGDSRSRRAAPSIPPARGITSLTQPAHRHQRATPYLLLSQETPPCVELHAFRGARVARGCHGGQDYRKSGRAAVKEVGGGFREAQVRRLGIWHRMLCHRLLRPPNVRVWAFIRLCSPGASHQNQPSG